MSVTVKKPEQPKSFSFNNENMAKAKEIVSHYPEGRQASAVLPLLDLAQRQSGNWLPRAAIHYVASFLEMPPIKVYEVATFYTMFNLEPVGQYHIQMCHTTPCWIAGSDKIAEALTQRLGITAGQTTADGKFTWSEVECLGACANAPVVQINDDYYEDLTPETIVRLVDDLAAGRKPTVGSQTGRKASCASSGPTTLQGSCCCSSSCHNKD